MYTLIISSVYGDNCTEAQFHVGGCEAAYEAFRKACDLCEIAGGSVTLIDTETAEVVADNWDEEDLEEA